MLGDDWRDSLLLRYAFRLGSAGECSNTGGIVVGLKAGGDLKRSQEDGPSVQTLTIQRRKESSNRGKDVVGVRSKKAGHLHRKGSGIDHNRVYRIICEAGLNHPSVCPKENTVTVLGRRVLGFAAAITGYSAFNMAIPVESLARSRLGVQTEKMLFCCLKKPLNGMVFWDRCLLIRAHSISPPGGNIGVRIALSRIGN